MWFALTALLLAAAAPEAGEARALFERMEKKVLESKTFAARVEFDIAGPMDATGRLRLAAGNRMRLEIETAAGGKPHKATTVSDGERLLTIGAVPRRSDETPKHLTRIFLSSVTRGGVWLTMVTVLEHREPAKGFAEFDLDKDAAVSDFKLGAKETVSSKAAQAVEYTLKAGRDALAMTVWIDVETHLPLKRVIKAREKDGADQVIMTETYRDVAVDGQIDDKEFEVPK